MFMRDDAPAKRLVVADNTEVVNPGLLDALEPVRCHPKQFDPIDRLVRPGRPGESEVDGFVVQADLEDPPDECRGHRGHMCDCLLHSQEWHPCRPPQRVGGGARSHRCRSCQEPCELEGGQHFLETLVAERGPLWRALLEQGPHGGMPGLRG